MASGRRGSIDETTAGEACAEAPNQAVAKQVEETANLEHEAAEQAASVAKELGPKYTGERVSAVGKLGMEASQVLNKAVEEGKRDVTGGVKEGAGNIKETAAKV
ncbi:hypothetical protein AGABI2DRAFT_132801, partial [Agaricus bisporus var. bisporus H97]|uniref:hypothetical protein n=1 Tax=Agaricus bisporus var. bisporus (strain H97 / ATCC MYA-4626 / FGSC 10389) TaxID=936046 RepID=UPI00029F7BF9